MREQRSRIPHKNVLYIFLIAMLAAVSTSCDIPTPPPKVQNENPDLPQAEVVFTVIAAGNAGGQAIGLEILDEVTGYGSNGRQYSLSPIDPQTYQVTTTIPIGSLVKYRYRRNGITPEYSSLGLPVNYRTYYVTGPTVITDIISAWQNVPYAGATGRIEGNVSNYINNAPIPSVIVSAGGINVLTSSDGSFTIEGLPPGVHTVVAYTLDGSYQPFQQEARVAEGAITPAPIRLTSTKFVDITFRVTPPPDNIPGVPIRMIGNIYNLGNTFGDTSLGSGILPVRAPLLQYLEDGTYFITLSLPVGLDLRYKYTLGDGYWNSERTEDGSLRTRQLIVPAEATMVTDVIFTWQEGDSAPVTFQVVVPGGTPPTDNISIQFKTGVWGSPIPIWPVGNNEWTYRLFSPFPGNVEYRYCRNDQCGIADEVAPTPPRSFGQSGTSITLKDTIFAWEGWKPSGEPTTIIADQINNKGELFIAGVEFSPEYEPAWQSYLPEAFKNLNDIQANWVVLSPRWTVLTANPPSISILPGKDPLWYDNLQAIQWAKQRGLKVALYPRVQLPIQISQSGQAGIEWWYQWFTYYRGFVIHHADLAQQSGADALILGGAEIWLSIPGAADEMGGVSLTPPEFIQLWDEILNEARARYGGKMIFALPYPHGLTNPSSIFNYADLFYLEISTPLSSLENPSIQDLENEFTRIVEQEIKPWQQQQGKTIIFALQYPSSNNASAGCSDCTFGRSTKIINNQAQIDIYTAALRVINRYDWLSGLVAKDYYPPVALQDASASIHGKPVSDIFWYWFPRLMGKIQ